MPNASGFHCAKRMLDACVEKGARIVFHSCDTVPKVPRNYGTSEAQNCSQI